MNAAETITLEFLQDLLGGGDPPVTVTSFQVRSGAGTGDNYTSTLYRVSVRGTVGGSPWRRSLMCKCLPADPEQRQVFKSDLLFRNEVAFYTEALPALLEFQREAGGGGAWRGVARCLLARGDLLVLEDLAERGFRMADRRRGLDAAHCGAALRQLARLHGLALAMKRRRPQRFRQRVAGALAETFFVGDNSAWYREYYRSAADNAVAMVGKFLAEEDGEAGARYLQRLRDFACDGDFFGRMVALVQPREPLAVLCHGDCWTNNLLFRYGDDGAIVEVCLIDFQIARYASPALDISNLLYVCTTPEMRAQHGRQLLRDYHSSLVDTLRGLGCEQPSAEELWDMLEVEMRDCGRFGLGLALDMLPITTCETGEMPRLREGGDSGAGAGPAWSYQCTEECARRMAGLVKELVDSGQL
ncbi:uncharacterized protein LOC126259745 [Schistocerca nitens]|uniref:uncharacterized protein LOC126259745 n=1 Tax=Schistocerca nitens TaxID=7011 RepID=UPI00211971A2|nr:uncharacterized protein LOC126259745 [Schistocerca nitens]